jgi:hypothetical protein
MNGYDTTLPEAWVFDPSVIAAFRMSMGTNQYTFALSRASTLVSGTGTLTINTSFNLTAFAEGAALIALFDECKVVSGHMLFSTGTLGGLNSFSEYACMYPSEDSNTPTISMITRVPNSILFGTGAPCQVGYDQRLKWHFPGRMWGYTLDEAVSAPRIISGFNATLKAIVAVGTPSNSTSYFSYLAKVVGRFRMRT